MCAYVVYEIHGSGLLRPFDFVPDAASSEAALAEVPGPHHRLLAVPLDKARHPADAFAAQYARRVREARAADALLRSVRPPYVTAARPISTR